MMSKDLTTSSVHRLNILNNKLALNEIETQLDLRGVTYNGQVYFTKKQIAQYYDVDERTIDRYIENFSDELKNSGYLILMYNSLKQFKLAYGNDTNVATMPDYLQRTSVLGVFSFKAFLNVGMLLTESQSAKELRSFLLDIVLDTFNQKIGGNTKYINQNDNTFLESSLREYNYRKEFTNALDIYLKSGKFKYGVFT
ncbi:MAG: DNA-binding protein, partial [Bacteroidota bacterium]